MVHATVRGTEDYRVDVTRHDDRFTASCTCPYFTDRDEICKHIWAVMLAAERRELLGGDGLPLPASFVLNPDLDAIDRAPSPSTRSRVEHAQPRPPATPWARLLKAVQQSLATNERDTPQPRFTNGEILYAVSSGGETAPDTIGLTVQFRQRKKNGEWGKPRPVTLSVREIEQLTNPDDREILSLLMGAADHWGYQSQGYDFTYQVRTAYRLSGLVAARVLPLTVRTGRAYLAGTSADTLAPLNWEEGGPWRFELAVKRSAADRSVTLDGTLVRGVERRALADVQPLGAGCAIVGIDGDAARCRNERGVARASSPQRTGHGACGRRGVARRSPRAVGYRSGGAARRAPVRDRRGHAAAACERRPAHGWRRLPQPG